MTLAEAQALVRKGRYSVRPDAVTHMVSEGFEERHIVEAVLNGAIIEEYPQRERFLVFGNASLTDSIVVPMHVVCEYADPSVIEFVTAYIPDPSEWEHPPTRRR